MSLGSRSLDPPTADEKRRTAAAKAKGCVACLQLGITDPKQQCGLLEENHILVAGGRIGHRYTYVLGLYHHQGRAKPGWSLADTRERFGPNLYDNRSTFHARFGSDQALQNDTDDLVGWPRVPIPSRREARLARDPAAAARKERRTTASSKTCKRPEVWRP